MPLTETLLGGAVGGFGGAMAGESLKPITGQMTDWHRIALLLLLVAAIIAWFVLLPPRRKRRAP